MQLGGALGDKGVELVEEYHAWHGAAGAHEDLAQGALGFADVLGDVSGTRCGRTTCLLVSWGA
jgi:hypothetical protein